MAKKITSSFKNISHGKAVGHGTALHLGPIGGKGKGKAHAQTSGHVDPFKLTHDAKGHEKGSRGPFTKSGTGKHKSK